MTDAGDVRRTGREVVERLALTGVAKLDFKRDLQGNLRLLEINPRFNLWHHRGAIVGVNIPALVYADLTGAANSREGRHPLMSRLEGSPRRPGRRHAVDDMDALDPRLRSAIVIVVG
jgi:ATP-grasp in the biosynthetic pathway with Ter operon